MGDVIKFPKVPREPSLKERLLDALRKFKKKCDRMEKEAHEKGEKQ